MMFRCLDTGRELNARQVRIEKAQMTLPSGRKCVTWFPADPAKWDAKLLELARIERVEKP